MRRLALFGFGLFWGLPVFAAAISAEPDAVAVTIYHTGDSHFSLDDSPDEGLALITETRQIDVPAGPAQIRFRGVAATLVPQTIDIKGLADGTIDHNFDYDLLAPGTLLSKSVGATVRLVRTDPRTGKVTEQDAIIRSGPNGVVLETGGKFEALGCGGPPEKLVFDQTPHGLADTPTLSVHTNAPRAGHYTVKLSYIATGLNWSADYVVHIHPDGRTLTLTGWVTLANLTSTSFATAPVQVVAGKLSESGDDTPQDMPSFETGKNCWPMNPSWTPLPVSAGDIGRFATAPPPMPAPNAAIETVVVTGVIGPQRLGDYKLYQLPEPTAVAARQIKQVQFIDQPEVPFRKIYVYEIAPWLYGNAEQSYPADVALQLDNTKAAGLGLPLPAGGVSVMEPAANGSLVLIGEQNLRDTAEGLPVEILTGHASDVRVSARITDSKSLGRDGQRKSYEVVVHNGKATPIRLALRDRSELTDMRVVSESQSHTLQNGAMTWTFSLQPGEEAVLDYTVETSSS